MPKVMADMTFEEIGDTVKKLSEEEQDPYNGFTLSGKYTGLRYLKVTHKRVEYRVVYDVYDESKEVLIVA